MLPPQIIKKGKAEKIAEQLNTNSEDGWTYNVCYDPTGSDNCLIDIYDDDGIFISKL